MARATSADKAQVPAASSGAASPLRPIISAGAALHLRPAALGRYLDAWVNGGDAAPIHPPRLAAKQWRRLGWSLSGEIAEGTWSSGIYMPEEVVRPFAAVVLPPGAVTTAIPADTMRKWATSRDWRPWEDARLTHDQGQRSPPFRRLTRHRRAFGGLFCPLGRNRGLPSRDGARRLWREKRSSRGGRAARNALHRATAGGGPPSKRLR